jgi:hypothetical protein
MNVEVREAKRVSLSSVVEMIGGKVVFTQNVSGEWSAELFDCRGERLLISKLRRPGPDGFCCSRYTATHDQALQELAAKLTDSDPMMVWKLSPSRGWWDIFRESYFQLDLRHTLVVSEDHRPGTDALRTVLCKTGEWLARQKLPAAAAPLTTSISAHCSAIQCQLVSRDPGELVKVVASLNKLLATELSTLVLSYHRMPFAARLMPWVSASADELLLKGLRAVNEELGTIQKDLANRDLRDLAIQARTSN